VEFFALPLQGARFMGDFLTQRVALGCYAPPLRGATVGIIYQNCAKRFLPTIFNS
jgi:hypothetical protein